MRQRLTNVLGLTLPEIKQFQTPDALTTVVADFLMHIQVKSETCAEFIFAL